jgi:cation diffusion facilitator family transporter
MSPIETDSAGAERQRSIRRVLWWILFANLAVAFAKFIYGSISGLVSLRADGIHSFTDGASNIIGLLAVHLASAPPDREHPYGHRKFEVAVSLGIGVFILFSMTEIVRAVISAALGGVTVQAPPASFAVAGGTLLVNLGVAWYEHKKGKELNSMILTADARHTLSDCISTVMVLAGLGFNRLGYARADLVAAGLVVLMIIGAAWEIFKAAGASLLDEIQLDPEGLREEALKVKGVAAVHAIRSRGLPDAIFVDLHILVDPDITVREGHGLAHEVMVVLRDRFPEVLDVLVHVEPWDDEDQPDYEHGRPQSHLHGHTQKRDQTG